MSEQQFFDGERVLDWEEAICLVPGMTLDNLASYEDDKDDKSPQRREVAKAMAALAGRKSRA